MDWTAFAFTTRRVIGTNRGNKSAKLYTRAFGATHANKVTRKLYAALTRLTNRCRLEDWKEKKTGEISLYCMRVWIMQRVYSYNIYSRKSCALSSREIIFAFQGRSCTRIFFFYSVLIRELLFSSVFYSVVGMRISQLSTRDFTLDWRARSHVVVSICLMIRRGLIIFIAKFRASKVLSNEFLR